MPFSKTIVLLSAPLLQRAGLLKSLNQAYEDSPSADEREQMRLMRHKQRRLTLVEW